MSTGIIPNPISLDEDLWRVDLPMGSTDKVSTCVIDAADRGRVVVIDPGWPGESAFHLLRVALRRVHLDVADVGVIAVTHRHIDHGGLADRLREATGAVLACAAAPVAEPIADTDLVQRWGVDADLAEVVRAARDGRGHVPLIPDVPLADGEPLPGSPQWTTLATPGHTPDHLCFVGRVRALVLTGDHLLPDVYPGIGLGGSFRGNPVAEYLDSLDRLAPFEGMRGVPGHGPTLPSLARRVDDTRRHVAERLAGVRRALEDDPSATVVQIAGRIHWRAGWEAVSAGPSAVSALRQTEYYRDLAMGS